MNRDRTAFRRWLLSVHVADWQRWQRAKGIAVAVIVFAALIAMGGTEWDPNTEPTGNLGLSFVLLLCAAALIWNIEHRRR